MKITSKNNSFIKELIKEKAKNRFLLFLDTPNLVKEALNSNFTVKHIFVEIGKQFDFIINKHSDKVVFVSKHILQAFSDVKTSAGIVAVFEFQPKPFKQPKGNFLVLDKVQEAGNVGTILRTAQATNFNDVYLLDCASVTNSKTVRASSGAIFKLNIFEMKKQDFLESIKSENLYLAVLDGENVFETKIEKNIGLVLGNEGKGISKEFFEFENTKKITLPMKNNLESLNVAVSGSVLMYVIDNNNVN